ncbi:MULTISPECIES: putative bifunctional diguanylate cyclase/phosphodiesterase [Geobacillus]|uniref:GGDEF domain-containing protein n=1 Tax=Geobacillus zalihae TaxID=213419 RepID=A0A7H1RU38_9BACL|nr:MULTISPECIES: bifunctional diguanylate cyclase/phosphodiesterase [Geobacillus]EPR29429.1 Membrane-associated sensor domain [Geobacillus sp. WSUCF1]OQP23965.1 GGDEF domain-containing protein [Geobacillus zalihae]QNU17777.1 GGDEF domain-containing protein [Geobacillus zalihae]
MSNQLEYILYIFGLFLTVGGVYVYGHWMAKRHWGGIPWLAAPRLTVVFATVSLLFLGAGMIYIHYAEKQEHREYEEATKQIAGMIAGDLAAMGHERLDERAEHLPAYHTVMAVLERWQHYGRVLSVYTLKKNEHGELYFVAAPATDYNRNGRIDGETEQAVPPGTVYRRHFPEIEEAFHGRFAMEQHPITDEWGRSISAFMPIRQSDGTVDAVVGIDFDAKTYEQHLQRGRKKALWTMMAMFLASAVAYLLALHQQMERKALAVYKKTLASNEHRLRRLAEMTMEGLIVYAGGKIIEVNEAACRLLGYTESELVHLPVDDLVVQGSMTEARSDGERKRFEIELRRKDGTVFPAEVLQRRYDYEWQNVMVAAVRDLTEQKQNERRLQYFASHDELTGLPNKEAMYKQIEQCLAGAKRNGQEAAVMFLEVSGIKTINDFYGYAVGDEVLLQLARLWREQKGIMVGRWSGNEFIAVLPDSANEKAEEAAKRLIEAADEPIVVNGLELYVTVNIGISVYPKDGEDAKTLIRKADIARYEARKKAASDFLFFTEPMAIRLNEKMAMERDLRRALEHEEFELYYQPQIRLHDRQVIGMEALIRWRHPEKGMVSPSLFIPVAEQTGMIIPINEWVIRTACRQTKQLLDRFPHLSVSVNLSPYEFESRRFVDKLAGLLADTGLPPHHLDLEITERMTMDTERALDILSKLKGLGVTISMDDFGTGYSSLSYLTDLPIDRLKIDRSFVQHIQGKKDVILPAIIRLGHNIGVKVLAEGVETETEAAYLQGKRCDEAQGYYFSPPLPYDELVRFLNEQRVRRQAQELR